MKLSELDKVRFLTKVDRTETCWLWTGFIDAGGYGKFWINGGKQLSHRVSYADAVGPIAPGRVIDHLCRVRNCVRPDHLEQVTQRINVRRGTRSASRHPGYTLGTHCGRGHELTDANTYTKRGNTECVECRRTAAREYQRRSRVAAERTHCVNGHEFTSDSTYVDTRGCTRCRVCARERQKRYRASKPVRIEYRPKVAAGMQLIVKEVE